MPEEVRRLVVIFVPMEQATSTLIAAAVGATMSLAGVLIGQWWQARNAAFSIKFGRLHEDRVCAMVEIYGKLYSLRNEVWEYLKLMRHGTENVAGEREQGYNALKKSMDGTFSYYRQRKFYFDKPMFDSIEEVFTQLYKIEEIIHPHHMSSVIINKMDVETDQRKKMREELDGALKILHGEVQDAMELLENSMRKLFGVAVPTQNR